MGGYALFSQTGANGNGLQYNGVLFMLCSGFGLRMVQRRFFRFILSR